MKSWRSWWTALSVATLLQLSCGGESNEPNGSSAGRSGDGGQSGSASSTGGKAGRSGTGGRPATSGQGGDSGEAGEASSAGTPFGGRAGATGSAGTAATGGAVGTAGASGSGFSGSSSGNGGTTSTVPFNWYCAFSLWNNGDCNCGCGVRDVDCDDGDIDECDTCNSPGSCSGVECPGRINADNPAICTPAPGSWTCPDYAYWDSNYCDCGCGVVDPDCEDATNASCDKCNLYGSCSSSNTCPSSIDAEDNSKCDIPEGWSCDSVYYLDGTCDCGCGVVDGDCSSASSNACETCWNGCAQTYCPGPIDAENNAVCTGVPVTWRCLSRFYDDGSLCHCGCGALNPDCTSDQGDSCDRCDFQGSCSARACPGTIDPEDNRYCVQPQPPPEWTCSSYRYADGDQCDCGCGAVDLDCATSAIGLCESCSCGTACPGRVDPNDTTSCLQPPPEWTCEDYQYGDGYSCTCGCGVPDPDCPSALAEDCSDCPQSGNPLYGSCSRPYCQDINPADNTRCNPTAPAGWDCHLDYYGDRACDCGCGVRDLDCESGSSSECDLCAAGESCSPPGCAAIDPDDNAVCSAG